MSDILKITTPMTPKNYVAPSMRQPTASEQFIDIANLSKVIKTNDKTETAKQDVNEFQSKEPMGELARILRDPSMGAAALKNLLSDELITALGKLSGTGLGKELSEIANSVFINSDFLTAEMADQQKFMSIFKGEIFDYMRAILDAAPSSEEVKLAVSNFLKAVVTEQSRGEMLIAVSSNLESLAREIAPLRDLASNLVALSQAFKNASPENIPKLRATMLGVFAEISGSILMDTKVERMMSLIIYNISKYNASPNLINDNFNALLSIFTEEGFKQNLTQVLNDYLKESNLPTVVTKAPFETVVGGSSAMDNEESMAELEAFRKAIGATPTEKNSGARPPSQDFELASVLSKLMTQEDATKLALELVSVPEKAEVEAKAKAELLSQELVDQKPQEKVETQKNLQSLLLSKNAADKEGAQGSKLTKSVVNLVDMLKENLSNPLLRSMSGNDVTNLLRSLLVAPNSAAPLMHFVLPARDGAVRAFGELWVDPDHEKGKTDREERDSVHMLLSAEIPDIGSFEIELLSKVKNLNVLLLCPPGYVKEFSAMKTDIARAISAMGFSVRGLNVAGLVRKRSLPEVFPNVYESKGGLNIKI